MERTNEIAIINKEWVEECPFVPDEVSTSKPFIEANTIEASLDELGNKHIIPVYVKDNEPAISHAEFINQTALALREVFWDHSIAKPSIRLSHPIKGRVPEARNKAAVELLEHEKTLYYERMAFVIEIPDITVEVNGNKLSLIAGGVKAYNLDNLYAKKGADEHFKVFIGFQNSVCTNMCIWSDGFIGDLKVRSVGQLKGAITELFLNYNEGLHIHQMEQLGKFSLTEQQFAQIIGKCRMYPHLPKGMQQQISPLLFGDTQLGTIVKDYYRDSSFCRGSDGNINLWKLYNLFTGANKSSYIDTFVDKSVNAYHFVEQIKLAVEQKHPTWFLN